MKLDIDIDRYNTIKTYFFTHDFVRIVSARRYKIELTILDQKKRIDKKYGPVLQLYSLHNVKSY